VFDGVKGKVVEVDGMAGSILWIFISYVEPKRETRDVNVGSISQEGFSHSFLDRFFFNCIWKEGSSEDDKEDGEEMEEEEDEE
jgi:hypothetical protein